MTAASLTVAATAVSWMPDALLSQRRGRLAQDRPRHIWMAASAIGAAAAWDPDGVGQRDARLARRRAPGGGVQPVVDAARLKASQCGECGGSCCPSRAAARTAERMVSAGRRLRVYQRGDYRRMASLRGLDCREHGS